MKTKNITRKNWVNKNKYKSKCPHFWDECLFGLLQVSRYLCCRLTCSSKGFCIVWGIQVFILNNLSGVTMETAPVIKWKKNGFSFKVKTVHVMFTASLRTKIGRKEQLSPIVNKVRDSYTHKRKPNSYHRNFSTNNKTRYLLQSY